MNPSDVTNFAFRIDCETGKALSADVTADILVEAKHYLSGTWVNIETGEIDLSPWDGSRQSFDGRITAAAVSALTRRTFNLKVL
ncbi:MAG: hypothetical protein WBP82_00325 [Leuconostoc mesenteroides]